MKSFKHQLRFSAVLILSGVISTLSVPVFATTYYRITDLGDLPGGTDFSVASGINESGQVVGWSVAETGTRAFLWQSGVMTDLGDLQGGDDSSEAWAINDAGQVVGNGMDAETQRAILWEAGTMIDLGDLPGSVENAYARDINSMGQVVGRSIAADTYSPDYGQATFWESAGSNILGLGDLPGGRDESSAHAINDVGQVVGQSEATSGTRAFLWEPGNSMIDLGELPGGEDHSVANDINNSGQVVGKSQAAEGERAFLWDSGEMINLGDLGGELNRSWANAINDASQVVGTSNAPQGGDAAFIWDAENGMQNLNDLIDPNDPLLAESVRVSLVSAYDINDAGQVVGSMVIDGIRRHAYRLTPTPSTRVISYIIYVVIFLILMYIPLRWILKR